MWRTEEVVFVVPIDWSACVLRPTLDAVRCQPSQDSRVIGERRRGWNRSQRLRLLQRLRLREKTCCVCCGLPLAAGLALGQKNHGKESGVGR